MDIFVSLILFFISLVTLIFLTNRHKSTRANLPPGKAGWPIVGETLELLLLSRRGKPEKFIHDRMDKYSPEIFRTSLFGDQMIMFCGVLGNKFLFSNENKLVMSWWPRSVHKMFSFDPDLDPTLHQASLVRDTKQFRGLISSFFKIDTLQKYIPIMDSIARRHIDKEWAPKREVVVFKLCKKYTFELACQLFMSIQDSQRVDIFANLFENINAGLISLPINFPGTAFNRSIKGAEFIRKELFLIIKKRKMELREQKELTPRDLLSHFLLTPDDNGNPMSEVDIANKILGLLIGGFEGPSNTIAFMINYLAELPHVFHQVYKEQMEIVKFKGPKEALNWEDIQKMKYTWNVACEALRLAPPTQGGFKEVLTDFTYSGFTIPKGSKACWSVHSTHKNPTYFSNPEKFDPSRFEGNGPAPHTFIPFGGGPRMCPGKELARLKILIFMHNLVTKFKWEKLTPDEKIIFRPSPILANGLPIRLQPY